MTEKIPVWALRLILAVSLAISAAALFLTRTYAVGNLSVLGLDADTVFVRRLSIDVLLAAHVAALFIATILPQRYFRLRRWQLYTLALAIWAFDGAAIYQARFGVMDKADTEQHAALARLADQRAAIKGLQDSAAALRVTAARQLANKMITAGSATQREAARLDAKAAAMAEQLAAMPTGTGTTEVRVWGWMAPYKAVTESALISFVSLIMLGLSALMGRELLALSAARRPAPVPSPAPVHAPAEPVAPAQVQKHALAAPAQVQKPALVAPARTPAEVRYSDKLLKTLGLGIAGAGAAVAPAVKAEPVELAAPAEPVAPVRVQEVQKPAPAVAPAQVRSKEVRKQVPTGLREAIKSGSIRPSEKPVRDFTGCNRDTAKAWLVKLGEEGLIEWIEETKRWKLKGKS